MTHVRALGTLETHSQPKVSLTITATWMAIDGGGTQLHIGLVRSMKSESLVYCCKSLCVSANAVCAYT